jgi:hypothetical protein
MTIVGYTGLVHFKSFKEKLRLMKTKANPFSISVQNDKFVVTKNGHPVSFLPSNGGQQKVTEFDTKEDATRYMNILLSLSKNDR